MVLLLHITIALSSLASTGLAFASPSAPKIRAAYILFCLTLISGTYLVLSIHAPLARACITGLAYTALSLAAIISAQLKLAKFKVTDDKNNPRI